MKRASLADNVKAAAAAAAAAPAPILPDVTAERENPVTRATAAKRSPVHRVPGPGNEGRAVDAKRAPSREGRKAVYAWVDPAEHLKLKRLALDTGRSIDALVTEGLALLFAEHGILKK